MRRPLEIFGRLRTAPGRKRIILGAFFRTWRIFFPVAGVYRRSLIRSTRMVAVVGSFGKTTTTRFVHAALGLTRRPPRGLNSGAFLANELLHVRPGDRYGVLEVGISRKGMMARCARFIRPDVVVVTSIGSEHHRSLGSLESTRNEKADMVRALPRSGLAVLNGDDANVLWMHGETRARVLTYGFGAGCDVRASDLVFDVRNGMRFTLHVAGATLEMSSAQIGRYQAVSLLAAIAAAVGSGEPLAEVLERLRDVTAVPGRHEVMALGCGAFLLVDTHKSILETILSGLETLDRLAATRKTVVLGDIEDPQGPQGPQYKDLGARLARIAGRVIHVGSRKTYLALASGARAAGMPKECVLYAGRSPRLAAELVRKDLRCGEIVLIKGRSTQQLERVAFDLAGDSVPCDIAECHLKPGCAKCPLTERRRRKGLRRDS